MDPMELVRQVTALTGFTRTAGVEVIAAESGRVTMSLHRKPELLQFNGFFHGGVVSGLADHAAGAAATTALPAGKIAVTVDLHVNFLAPASGSAIVARARTLQVGTTLCVVTVEVDTEAAAGAQPCAVANAVLRVVDLPPVAIALLSAISFRGDVRYAAILPVIALSWLARLLRTSVSAEA